MQKHPPKRPNFKEFLRSKALLSTACGILAVVLAVVCISIIIRSRMQREYHRARTEIGVELYTDLYMLCQTFDQVNVPGQDVENVLLPKMREYYVSAQALNTALSHAFGERYRILGDEHLSVMNAAFGAYDTAFKGGKTTETAQASMQSGVDMLRALLNDRFPGGLLPAQ